MFGTKMTHDGTAKVVTCEMNLGGMNKTNSHGQSISKHDLILDVYPEGAAPFRAEAREWFMNLHSPMPGDSLKVRCNPQKKAVEIDLSQDERYNPELYRKTVKERKKAEHEAMLDGPVGAPRESLDPELDELLRMQNEAKAGQDE